MIGTKNLTSSSLTMLLIGLVTRVSSLPSQSVFSARQATRVPQLDISRVLLKVFKFFAICHKNKGRTSPLTVMANMRCIIEGNGVKGS